MVKQGASEERVTSEIGAKLFYVDPDDMSERHVIIRGGELHHLRHVLRLGPHDECHVFDGKGHRYRVMIEAAGSAPEVAARILEDISTNIEKPLNIVLAQAIPQRRKFDLIVEKATELGVETIIPLLTDRTIAKFTKTKEDKILERWRTISIQAAKQSRQDVLPKILKPQLLRDVRNQCHAYDIVLMPSPQESCTIKEALTVMRAKREERTAALSVLLVIGPEGGFTDEERSSMRVDNVCAVTLGHTILKTDTAMVTCVGILQNCM